MEAGEERQALVQLLWQGLHQVLLHQDTGVLRFSSRQYSTVLKPFNNEACCSDRAQILIRASFIYKIYIYIYIILCI
jgi:hypothetical protein